MQDFGSASTHCSEHFGGSGKERLQRDGQRRRRTVDPKTGSLLRKPRPRRAVRGEDGAAEGKGFGGGITETLEVTGQDQKLGGGEGGALFGLTQPPGEVKALGKSEFAGKVFQFHAVSRCVGSGKHAVPTRSRRDGGKRRPSAKEGGEVFDGVQSPKKEKKSRLGGDSVRSSKSGAGD